MGRLQGKVALVIGGSGGIGGTIARGYAAEGARIGIAGRTAARVDAALAALKQTGAEVIGHVGDLAGAHECAAAMDKIIGAFGRIDILVNSQGVTVLKPAADVTEDDYDRVLRTNLRSVFFACQAAHKHMRRQGGGAIINIASLSAHRGWTLAAPYAASKHGVLALTKSFAIEWAGDGVRVNSITPGFYKTDLNRNMSPAREAEAIAGTPARRFGELGELVGAAVFLASEEAKFVTGADIAVDGGFLAQGI
jgi:NAD(P)-dependent dehydrogenase (short-subunit alcohol dehydrogenase family)